MKSSESDTLYSAFQSTVIYMYKQFAREQTLKQDWRLDMEH